MQITIPNRLLSKFTSELKKLDEQLVEVNGVKIKPSNCYFITNNPSNILFNTYCPSNLKETVKGIVQRYVILGHVLDNGSENAV